MKWTLPVLAFIAQPGAVLGFSPLKVSKWSYLQAHVPGDSEKVKKPSSSTSHFNKKQKLPTTVVIGENDTNNNSEEGKDKRKSFNKKQKLPTTVVIGENDTNNNSKEGKDKRKMDLMWCQSDRCQDVVRERVVGDHNTIVFNGPATGQIAYRWNRKAEPIISHDNDANLSPQESSTSSSSSISRTSSSSRIASVLVLVKRNDEDCLQKAAKCVSKITSVGINVLLAPEMAAKLKHYYGVDDERISLFEQPTDPNEDKGKLRNVDDEEEDWVRDMNYREPFPDLVVTLGGDGMLIYASMLFQGPIPPILAISGGSLGFLTPFTEQEMIDAIKIALGMTSSKDITDSMFSSLEGTEDPNAMLQVFPPNMLSYPYESSVDSTQRFTFGLEDYICLTIRMRLDCRIVNRDGVVRARYNVLNEVVIDRGSSPYLAALECFCDDVHLTTVQADGVIFAT